MEATLSPSNGLIAHQRFSYKWSVMTTACLVCPVFRQSPCSIIFLF